ncbi:hypothetical protein N8306_04755 [Yoonia sp.]|nr:hypothetical protein [Yoonia sp.]
MKLDMKLLVTAGLAALTAGCSSSTSDDNGTTFTSFADIEAAVSTAETDTGFDAANAGTDPFAAGSETDVVGVVTGVATYEGFVRVEDLDSDELIGALTLAVNFDTPSVTGSADNFYHEVDGAYTGSLTSVASGDILDAPGGDPMDVTLSGNLTNGGTTYTTGLILDGYFQDGGVGQPEAVGGTAIGTLDDGVNLPDILDGTFVAEIQ